MEVDDQGAVTLSQQEVLERFMQLEGLDPAAEDLRSLAGLGDRRFLQAALEGKPATPSFADAFAAHKLVDACYRSAAQQSGR